MYAPGATARYCVSAGNDAPMPAPMLFARSTGPTKSPVEPLRMQKSTAGASGARCATRTNARCGSTEQGVSRPMAGALSAHTSAESGHWSLPS